MNSSKFDVLASLVLSGEASEKQKAEFEKILKASVEHQIAFEKLKEVWKSPLWDRNEPYLKQKEALWWEYQVQRKSLKGLIQNNLLFRAAVLLIFFSFIYILIKPGSDTEQGTFIAIREVIKETNFGERLKTRLPDGTMVYLNAGSRLIYPENFTDSFRLVQLIGEGYFDVYEDKSRPFTVKTSSMEITALGTTFGVNVYNDNLFDQVSLVSGKLLIRNIKNQEIKMDSGQALALSRKDYNFSTSAIDYLAQIAWKDGIIHFKKNSFEEVIKKLEMNYGVHFKWNRHSPSFRDVYTGTFKNESLENVMEILSFSMNFKYQINGKEVIIEPQ